MEHGDLEQQALSFIDRFLAAHDQTRDAMRAEDATLADRLQAAAFALSMARATEFSPNIPLYTLLAAKVALLAYGPDSTALKGEFSTAPSFPLPNPWWRTISASAQPVPAAVG